MPRRDEQKNIRSPGLTLAADLLTLPISLGPVVLAWGLPLVALFTSYGTRWFWAALAFAPILAMSGLISGVRVVRALLPRMRPGLHHAGLNRGFLGWYLHLALSRAGELSGLLPMLQAFYVSKYLYWRAQGARIAFGVDSSMLVSIVDFPMIEVGAGSTLTDGVCLSAHTFVGDKLYIAPVRIGRNVFVGFRSFVGTRTTLGDGSRIGIGNFIANARLDPGTRLADYAWREGRPAAEGSTPELLN